MPFLEEIDNSYNLFGGYWDFRSASRILWSLRRLNISHNGIHDFSLYAPSLTHFDISNNFISNLDLQAGADLQLFNCSGNPIARISWNLTYSPNFLVFDCFGNKLTKVDTSHSVTTTTVISTYSTATETVFVPVNNPTLVGSTIGLGIFSGISTLGWIILGSFFIYKKLMGRVIPIPTPGS